jgi:hypothetical protein
MTPNQQTPYHGPIVEGAQDRDNFVRDLVTVLLGDPAAVEGLGALLPSRPLSKSIKSVAPVVTLEQIKLHCHVDGSDEDALLLDLEMAAHIHTQNVLRREFGATVGENVKLAMLVLIAWWYRNREAVITGTIVALAPLSYTALLQPERDYPGVY